MHKGPLVVRVLHHRLVRIPGDLGKRRVHTPQEALVPGHGGVGVAHFVGLRLLPVVNGELLRLLPALAALAW